MKFQRINENVIKCVMTSEEMQIQGVRVEDLLDDRAKAEEFLQYVLSKARYEVDFVTNGDILNVQISVMNDGGLTMMISDDQNAAIKAIAEQFKERLREFARMLDESAQKNGDDSFLKDDIIRNITNAKDDEEVSKFSFWSHMATLDECINLAKALKDISDSPSSLYKYAGEYYLCIDLYMTKNQVAKKVFVMSEYSDDVSSDQYDYLMVKEHGQVIIKDNALESLVALG